MLHVWQASLQGVLRVWQPTTSTWHLVPNWQTIKDSYEDKVVCFYAPSQFTLHLVSSLPQAQLKQLGASGQQYLFEDMALTPVEQLRVRILPNLYNNAHLLYAMAINDVTGWQNSAKLIGFDIVALLPDFVLLPPPEQVEGVLQGERATVYHDMETTLIRQTENFGFTVTYLPLLLKSLPQLQEIDLLPAIGSLGIDSTDNTNTEAAASIAALYDKFDAQGILVNRLLAQPKPIQSPQRHALNFIEKVSQSKFSPYLKVAMLTALCAGILQMSADALQVYQYKQATEQVAEATNAQFSSWVAGQSLNPSVKVMTQMRPYLVAGSVDESAALATLERISVLIKQSNISAQSLSWDEQSMTLLLVSTERQGLDKLMRSLVEQGIDASLGRIEPNADGSIVGEVKVALTSKEAESV